LLVVKISRSVTAFSLLYALIVLEHFQALLELFQVATSRGSEFGMRDPLNCRPIPQLVFRRSDSSSPV
jgi:hypothetical protein